MQTEIRAVSENFGTVLFLLNLNVPIVRRWSLSQPCCYVAALRLFTIRSGLINGQRKK